MKNIHVIPTDKPSKIFYIAENFHLEKGQLIEPKSYHNVYITSDEEIKEWFIVNGINGYSQPMKYSVMFPKDKFPNGHDKNKLNLLSIILTTDQDLIKDGVQPIPDEFLEWFVKNPSCEEVKIESWQTKGEWELDYKIIIPQEEPKQETLEEYIKEVTKNFKDEMSIKFTSGGIKLGAKWQAERMYSAEDMRKAFEAGELSKEDDINGDGETLFDEWFEQFKKK